MAKKIKKIQDYDALYDVLRYYVDSMLKLSYRTIRYVGYEKIPQDGAVIYAPNHTNALMDALVILAMDRKAKVFVARADIFKNPTLARIFRFLKIMPIMRMRDGLDEVRKNNETIEKSVDVLRDKVPFCIFPEGQHQAKYSSLPLSKGIFRIAFQAQDLMPDMPLYIVPVGIRYGSFFRFRSTVRVQIGDPINVKDFLDAHSENTPQEQMNLMKDVLAERMQSSIFHIPNDEDYDATYDICAAVVRHRVEKLKSENPGKHMKKMDAYFEANNMTVKQVSQLKEQNPEKAQQLLSLGREASQIRKANNISLSSVSIKYPFWSRVLRALILILKLPYNIPVSILTLPIKLICGFLFTKLKDYAFRNSIRYLVNLVMWPILMVIYSIIAFVFLKWTWALLVILLLLPAPIVAHETYRLIRIIISDTKLLRNKELQDKYNQIRDIILEE
ncbi:MAG: 1-acyl-sn-glycerol-3-phosphate acyltransferase [Alistipes sp.]|nr:1-acyl-sn-glycerol-3-phosphate acyltransferase [Alistipes sp.]